MEESTMERYEPKMTVKETQQAIKKIKVYFEHELAARMNLTRVSAPMFVMEQTGLNDNLNGVERPVAFSARHMEEAGKIEIVHSLAKWKRMALKKYDFSFGEGLYTNMNAIRRDEVLDEIHSIYVDQWDFEKIISPYERSVDYLKHQVDIIYSIFLDLEKKLHADYPHLIPQLPPEITYITSQELLDLYPGLTTKERERAFVRENKAIFIIGIGAPLSNGLPHDGRAPDYDDWSLNGDLIFYNSILDDALELSSMGIRVDPDTLTHQLIARGMEDRSHLPFHQALLAGELPLTYGGGIGQSRICQFLLHKYHIGEVQCSIWPQAMIDELAQKGIDLL
ncbi:aspartate--ammonia ligase [Clostridiaceae bacterium HFYG-1003]|nr:aspartate--ammonia ligase [Clostridiaceae bacterium HFYG-1003]